MEDSCLFIRHLPAKLNGDKQTEFLKKFGAMKVRSMGNRGMMRNTAFAIFTSVEDAKKALSRLHQLPMDGRRLVVEFAHKRHLRHINKEEINHSNRSDAEAPEDIKPDSEEDSSLVLSSKMKVDFPLNPKLRYKYPAADAVVVENICRALLAVPRFYEQVLHLMNKMSLPCPFGTIFPARKGQHEAPKPVVPPVPLTRPPAPPLTDVYIPPAPSTNNTVPDTTLPIQTGIAPPPHPAAVPPPHPVGIPPPHAVGVAPHPVGVPPPPPVTAPPPPPESSEESEMESDDEDKRLKKEEPTPMPVVRTTQHPPRKRQRLLDMIALPSDSGGSVGPSTDEVFETSKRKPTDKKIEFKLGQGEDEEEPDVHALLDAKPIVEEGGFGKIQPIVKPTAEICGAGEIESDVSGSDDETPSDYIRYRDLRRGRLTQREMSELSIFRRYDPGEPTTRLYVKNLAKQVSEKDLRFVFGRYVNWNSEEEKLRFDIRLMKTGRMKDQAFITLPSEQAATDARRQANAYQLHGKPIVVVFARSAKPKDDDTKKKK